MSRYRGSFFVPPLYPTLVQRTPGAQPNCASGNQNQPRAKVATASVSDIVVVNAFFSQCFLRDLLGQFKDIFSRSVLLSYPVNSYPDTRPFILVRQEAHNSNHWWGVIRMQINRSIYHFLSVKGGKINSIPFHPTLSVYGSMCIRCNFVR